MSTVFQLLALLLTCESAYFISKSNLGLSPKVIAELASTKWNANLSIVSSLASQNADNWIGVILLIASVILQMAAFMFRSDWPLSLDAPTELLSSVLLGAVVFLACWKWSKYRAKALYEEAKTTIETKQGISF